MNRRRVADRGPNLSQIVAHVIRPMKQEYVFRSQCFRTASKRQERSYSTGIQNSLIYAPFPLTDIHGSRIS